MIIKFGWNESARGIMEMTQLEVAKEMGISRSRVYQIEQVALAKLKKRLSAIGIKREDVISRKYQGKSA